MGGTDIISIKQEYKTVLKKHTAFQFLVGSVIVIDTFWLVALLWNYLNKLTIYQTVNNIQKILHLISNKSPRYWSNKIYRVGWNKSSLNTHKISSLPLQGESIANVVVGC